MNELILLVLNALHGLLRFYSRSFSDVNVDGVFGLRILEVNRLLMDDIRELAETARLLGNKAIPHVFSEDSRYFTKFKYLIVKPWTPYFQPRLTSSSKLWPVDVRNLGIEWSESDVDSCLSELLISPSDSTIVEEDPFSVSSAFANSKHCNLTDFCLDKIYFVKGTKGYTLQHQLLYSLIANLVTCEDTVSDYLAKRDASYGLREFELEFCSNALLELQSYMKLLDFECIAKGSVPEDCFAGSRRFNSDLFFEQEFVCLQLGFLEFGQRFWLELILHLQSDSGCYLFNQSRRRRSLPFQSRKLLYEKILSDNCGSHLSAVAAGALVVYLSLLLEEFSGHNLNLTRQPLISQASSRLSIPVAWKFIPEQLLPLVSKFEQSPIHPQARDFEDSDSEKTETIFRLNNSAFYLLFTICLFVIAWRFARNQRYFKYCRRYL